MSKNIILIPPCFSHGDSLSVMGLLHYLLNHYDKVFFYVGLTNYPLLEFYNHYFSNDPLFNTKIFITIDPYSLINDGLYGDFDVCNTHTGAWDGNQSELYDLPNIDKEYYFNNKNPIYNKIKIPEKYIFFPNKVTPNKILSINHIFYYELIGLNNNVRMDYFNYVRNLVKEKEYSDLLLSKIGLTTSSKYNIINDPIGGNLTNHIDNDYPTINISNISPCVGYLLSLIENAETIHLIESMNTNFIYHAQYKNIMDSDKKIILHIWARNRNWPQPYMNLDFSWKMMNNPKLDSWEFKH